MKILSQSEIINISNKLDQLNSQEDFLDVLFSEETTPYDTIFKYLQVFDYELKNKIVDKNTIIDIYKQMSKLMANPPHIDNLDLRKLDTRIIYASLSRIAVERRHFEISGEIFTPHNLLNLKTNDKAIHLEVFNHFEGSLAIPSNVGEDVESE